MKRSIICALITIIGVLLCGENASSQSGGNCTPNESWISPGTGVPDEVLDATEMNGLLYVLHRIRGVTTLDSNRYGISAWNGTEWSYVTLFRMMHYKNQLAVPPAVFKAYNGMLYMGGNFSELDGDTSLRYLVKWDGTRWLPALDTLNVQSVSKMELHDGTPYIIASPPEGPRKYQSTVFRLENSRWTPLPPLPDSGVAMSMISWKGNLYIGGFRYAPAAALALAVKWDGTNWTSFAGDLYGSIMNLFIYRDHLYAQGDMNLHGARRGPLQWNDTAWQEDALTMDGPGYRNSFIVYDGQLYLADWLRIRRFDGTAWNMVSAPTGRSRMLVSYKEKLFLGGEFTESCGERLSNIAWLCNENSCGRISGTVFRVYDRDCANPPYRSGVAGRFIELSPGGRLAVTNGEGRYSFFAEKGSYTVSLRPHLYWNQLCPTSPETHSVTVDNGINAPGNDFGTEPIPGIRDLRVEIIASPARQGRQLTYAITYENAGSEMMDGTVRFTHDPVLNFDSAQTGATRYSPGVAEWDFTYLRVGESRTVRVWTAVPITTPMGTGICSSAEITPDQQDTTKADNRDSVCVPVTAGYDPNDIRVTPFGIADDGVITPQDSVLTYWVRFQNTGNDTAFKIVVVDTLSSNLDIASIKFGAASHRFSFSIDNSNVLVWTFNNILLPDSSTSEPNSHGFFKYSVKLKKALPPGTRITNQAHIYFDYNAPVPTNTVVSIIGAPMSVEQERDENGIAIYPNPTRDLVTIGAKLRPGAAVTMRTLLGETVRQYHHSGDGPMTLDLRDLPAGTYLLTAETADGVRSERVTVAR